ncbi:hypothetical protein ACJX0J_038563, partial [Zea mays]
MKCCHYFHSSPSVNAALLLLRSPLIMIQCHLRRMLQKLDVKTEEIYMDQPEGFTVPGKENFAVVQESQYDSCTHVLPLGFIAYEEEYVKEEKRIAVTEEEEEEEELKVAPVHFSEIGKGVEFASICLESTTNLNANGKNKHVTNFFLRTKNNLKCFPLSKNVVHEILDKKGCIALPGGVKEIM